ncbi:hypothetical protein VN97_g4671 [Penicillium thymicola]|uniref:Uncharacterized protein n=1 Tax=Penicillium thymicola TaxID=293382 RepID=A0AAI9TK43_PENTH|nr:hypothetical protein VN97_g4671 [Penicillium thymicola]
MSDFPFASVKQVSDATVSQSSCVIPKQVLLLYSIFVVFLFATAPMTDILSVFVRFLFRPSGAGRCSMLKFTQLFNRCL